MFGKWFNSAYTGSLAGSGADVFAVWTYAIAHAWNASVELNPLVVAGLIGMPVANVERAIEFLCQPDPKSRNPAHEGRRLIYESGYRYDVVSHPIYRNMRDDEERRRYLRVKQQESRARRKSDKTNTGQHLSTNVNTHQPASTQSESESESESVSDATHPHPAGSGDGEGNLSPGKPKKPEKPKIVQSPEEWIFQQYPRKEAKGDAIKAIAKAVKRIQKGELGHEAIPIKREAQIYLYQRVQKYARSPAGTRPDRDKIPHPATWMNGSRYRDEEENWQVVAGNGNQPAKPKLQLNTGTGPRDLADQRAELG